MEGVSGDLEADGVEKSWLKSKAVPCDDVLKTSHSLCPGNIILVVFDFGKFDPSCTHNWAATRGVGNETKKIKAVYVALHLHCKHCGIRKNSKDTKCLLLTLS